MVAAAAALWLRQAALPIRPNNYNIAVSSALTVDRFYYCKIDPRSTTGSYGRQECTCSSLHISPGLWGEADVSPNLQREVDDVRSGMYET